MLEELEECVAGSYHVEEMVYSVQLQRIMDDFVRNLPPRQQYIFVSRYYCQDKVREIAKALKLSMPMVFRELAAIRKKLRKRLDEETYLL